MKHVYGYRLAEINGANQFRFLCDQGLQAEAILNQNVVALRELCDGREIPLEEQAPDCCPVCRLVWGWILANEPDFKRYYIAGYASRDVREIWHRAVEAVTGSAPS